MSIALVTQPTKEPITLAFVKPHLNIVIDDDDLILSSYIGAARDHVEKMLSRSLITQTWDYSIDSFADKIEIPKPPLQSVTSIKYRDENGVTQTLGSSVYDVDTGVEPGVIRLAYDQSWPSIRCVSNAITIRFVAGYGDNPGDIPFSVRQAIALFVGHLYENREATAGITMKEVPMAFESLIGNFHWKYF